MFSGVLVFLLLVPGTMQIVWAESAEDFLAGLRERGWHDTALDYLAEAERDPLATSEFIEKIPFERATTQAALARLAPSEKLRQQSMVGAAEAFEQFATSQSGSPLALEALSSAGNLYAELALVANNKAEKLPAAAKGQRAQLGERSREYLSRAKNSMTSLLRRCTDEIESLPKAAELQKSKGARANRQQLEGKLAEAKFLLAKLDFETARTHDEGSKARQQKLKSAAKAFSQLYEEYEDKLVGFYGRFYEGRCQQLAGEIEKALKAYLEIVDQPPIPNRDFRRLVSRSYRYRAQCHVLKKDFDQAIEECREWLEESSGPELAEPDWLAVSYQLAKAYEAQATSGGGDPKRNNNEARKLYREIAKYPGEFQREAKGKLASGGGGRERPAIVRTFEQAFTAGKESLEQMNSARMAAGIAKENNPNSVGSLESEVSAERMAAVGYFQQALQLADSQSDSEDLAASYYFLCALYWESGQLEEAAVVGEFMARRFSDHPQAQVAAKIALAAFERMYNSAQQAGENTSFESAHLAEIAELLILRWPESPEAQAGLNLLINLALRDNRLADAEKILQQLPPVSRAGAELRLGGSLWTRYARAISGGAASASDATLQLKAKAGKLLESGFKALSTSPQVSASEASGVLYYAQFLLAEDRAGEAVAALENDSIGPLALIKRNSAAAGRAAFVQQAYRVGLQAYLSGEPPQNEKAKSMMTAMEATLGEGKDAQQKLINIYVSLGLQLQQQISGLTAEGKTAKARAVAESFALVLEQVTARAGAADSWKIQNWIARTNLQLGQGLSGADAEKYFQQATSAYQTLLAKAEKNPKFAPSPVSILATKKKLADCFLAQKKYAEAFKQYAFILKGKPSSLDLQLGAAAALQKWGTEEQDAKRLEEAIRGAMPQANRKNLVWGWLRIADLVERSRRSAAKKAAEDPKQAARAAKYEDLFFQARYHVAESRFAAAKLARGAERAKQTGKALQNLKSMQKLYPTLGGPKWQGAYLELMKQMEQVQ